MTGGKGWYGAVRVRVPAKLNLTLRVGPVRSDGYHPLATLFQAVSLYDELAAVEAPDGLVTCSVSGEGADQLTRPAQQDGEGLLLDRGMKAADDDSVAVPPGLGQVVDGQQDAGRGPDRAEEC